MAGASRTSSVSGLNANPQMAIFVFEIPVKMSKDFWNLNYLLLLVNLNDCLQDFKIIRFIFSRFIKGFYVLWKTRASIANTWE